MAGIEQIRELVAGGEDEVIEDAVKEALEAGMEAGKIMKQGLIEAMNIVGSKMATGEMFVPEVLLSAETMKAGLAVLKPYLRAGDIKSAGKIVIGTVAGDLHDIGKNLVAMMLESTGFEVIDLGTDQSTENFLQAIDEYKPNIVAMSALLTTTMEAMKSTTEAIRTKRIEVKIMVGGAPVNEKFASEIGADGFASDAAGAVVLAKKLIA